MQNHTRTPCGVLPGSEEVNSRYQGHVTSSTGIIPHVKDLVQAHISPFSVYRLMLDNPPLVLFQYASITLPFQTVFNGGWSSMSLYTEKGLLNPIWKGKVMLVY